MDRHTPWSPQTALSSRRGSLRFAVAAVVALLMGLSACAVAPTGTSTATATAEPTTTATPSADVPPAPRLAVVPAGIVKDLKVKAQESTDAGVRTHVALAVVPGAEAWETAVRTELKPVLADFRRSVQETATPTPTPTPTPSPTSGSDGGTSRSGAQPTLTVSGELVASSPQVLGSRQFRAAFGTDTRSRAASTSWWDIAAATTRANKDLIREDAEAEFFTRLSAAADALPGVDPELVATQVAAGWDSVRTLAFTASGALWIEFDGGQVSSRPSLVGVEVDATDLLSDFGAQARDAAVQPQDPAIPRPKTTKEPGHRAAGRCAQVACVALTFDDGPVPQTADVLDVLASENVHATFFVVGSQVAQHPEIVRRMVAEGNAVGNHSYSHPNLTTLSVGNIRSQLTRTSDAIESAAGIRPTILRPPYGATNANVRTVTTELGMAQVLWDVDTMDWRDRNTALVTQRAINGARAGSIILVHDIHPTTRAAVRGIVTGLKAKGYVLVTVPELFGNTMIPGDKYVSG